VATAALELGGIWTTADIATSVLIITLLHFRLLKLQLPITRKVRFVVLIYPLLFKVTFKSQILIQGLFVTLAR
jgi:hypothetical protein